MFGRNIRLLSNQFSPRFISEVREVSGLTCFKRAKAAMVKTGESNAEIHSEFLKAAHYSGDLNEVQLNEVLDFIIASKFSSQEDILKAYKMVFAEQPDDINRLFNFAEYLTDIGSYEEAKSNWQKIIALQPKNIVATIRLADCEFNLGNLQEAEVLLSKALEVQKKATQLIEKKAVILDKLERYQELSEFCIAQGDICKKSKNLSSLLVKSLFKSSKYEECIQHANLHLEGFGSDDEIFINRIHSMIELQQYKEALKLLLPTSPKNFYFKALIYTHLKENEIAKGFYKKAIELDPQNIDLHYDLGMLLYKEDNAESANHFQKVIAINPKHLPTLKAMSQCLMRLGRMEDAAVYIEEVLDQAPNDVETLIDRGRCYAMGSDMPSALDSFERILAFDPNNVHAIEKKGATLIAMERHEEGIALLLKSIEMGLDIPAIHNNLGGAYFYIGKYELALEHFEKAVHMDPGNKGFRENRDAAVLQYDLVRDKMRMAKEEEEKKKINSE